MVRLRPARCACAVLTFLTLGLCAAPADASLNFDVGDPFLLTESSPSADAITVDYDSSSRLRFTTNQTTLSITGGGCTKASNVVTCPEMHLHLLAVGLAIGNDSFDGSQADFDLIAFPAPGTDTFTGGKGDDHLEGGADNDTLFGGLGSDSLTDNDGTTLSGASAGGDDWLNGQGGDDDLDGGTLAGLGLDGDTSGGGKDLLDGGDGFDTVDYSQRTAPVRITVDTPGVLRNDGEAGEQDDVRNVERLLGGSAGDVFTASNVDSELDGNGGDDTLTGAASGDVLNGGAGTDTLDGGPAADALNGGPGADALNGDEGNDVLDGGPGADAIAAGAGDDLIHAQDGIADTISCGTGTDAVDADSFDVLAADCGGAGDTVTQAPVPPLSPGQVGQPGQGGQPGQSDGTTNTVTVTVPGPPVVPVVPVVPAGPVLKLSKTLRADRKGRVKVSIGCPKTAVPGCLFGTATLTTAPKKGKGKRLGSATFSARGGKTVKVVIALSAAGRKSLKKSGKLTAVLGATAMNGAARSKTTTVRVTVKR